MRICYVANSAMSHTAKWVNHFLSQGHEVHVVSYRNQDIEGAKVHYVDYNIRNFPIMVWKVHSLIKKINPDIIHAHTANTCGLYGVSMRGRKVVVSAWGSDILVVPNQSILLKKIVQHVIKNAYFMTSDSMYMTKKIVELGGNEDKIYTFPMGVEEEIINFKPSVHESRKVLKLISIRRLEKLYNIDIIIKGFYKAVMENENLHLSIGADGSEMNNLRQLVNQLGISDKVEFTGSYNPEDVGKLLSDKDVFISIPSSDSTSVSLLESMYCGLFPIVSDLQANREWVNHRENGIIIDKINEDNIKDAILWAYNNRDVLEEAFDKNTQIIIDRALWKNNAKIVEKLYEDIKNQGNS